MKNVDAKIVKITGNDDYGFLMYVDGNLMWTCETRQDVYDQIEHAKDNDFFDETTVIPEFQVILMNRFDFVWKKFDDAKDVKTHINLLFELNEKHGYISLTEAKEVIERLIGGEDLADIEESMFFRIF